MDEGSQEEKPYLLQARIFLKNLDETEELKGFLILAITDGENIRSLWYNISTIERLGLAEWSRTVATKAIGTTLAQLKQLPEQEEQERHIV